MSRAFTDYTDFDEVVVERLVAGRPAVGRVRPADAGEVIRRLAGLGYSDGQIAFRLGYWRRSVGRIRRYLGVPAALPSTGINRNNRPHDDPARPVRAG